ncbi:AAA family ATPase [Desulfobacterota bacterium AH_259_B03_O07]|nr:AAA family ATPase [Desulfobacterota bacterium AH_259_B03_O07]
MICSNCGKEISQGMNFCNACGTPGTISCPSCNFKNPAQSKFCGECGNALSEQITKSDQKHEHEAERRQLTVMFCDLVGSTQLSGQLDPEDLREVMRSYQEACAKVIGRFDGHIAKYLGDGLLVYFGYPRAHEDDPQRAVRAGLEIVGEVRELPLQNKMQKRPLQVRIGIHTGLVVVGEMGAGEVREQMAIVGETPNIAARLEGLAETNTVVTSRATYQLIEGYFDCKSMGPQTLKGISQPMEVYRVLNESGVRSRLEAAAIKGLTSLIGREEETGILYELWEKAKQGSGQGVLLSGEAGVGKSRLVQVLKDHLSGDTYKVIDSRCSPYYQNKFLYPVIEYLERWLQFTKNDSPEDKLSKLEKALEQKGFTVRESVPLFASLLSLPVNERYPALGLTPQIQKDKTQEALLSLFKKEMENVTVLFIVEDLHWMDPSSLEFLSLFLHEIDTRRVLAFLTFRPDFAPPWKEYSSIKQINLSRLSATEIELMAETVAKGKALPPEVIQQLVTKTDGIPLFVEELTKMVLESDLIRKKNGHYELTGPLPSLAIPSTLHDSLMARLDRLAPVREVAQMSATLGREFSYEMLSEVSHIGEDTLQKALSQLVDAEILYQTGVPPDSNYTFKHALIRDAAYESLLKSKRRQYHHRIAEVYEKKYKNDLTKYYPILAHHWDLAAGENRDYGEAVVKTIKYLELSGEMALRNGAFKEAREFLQKALDLYESLPSSEKTLEHELKLLKNLGITTFTTSGFGAEITKQVYERAWKLCEQIGETPGVFPILWGLWLCSHFSSDPDKEFELGAKLIDIAQKEDDNELLLQAHHAIWTSQMLIPDYKQALFHLEEGRKLYRPEFHENHCFNYGGHDPGMCCHRALCLINWTVGYPDKAIKEGYESIKLAQSHQFSLIAAHMATTFVHKQRGDIEQTLNNAELIIELAKNSGLPGYVSWPSIFEGWVMGQGNKINEGIALIEESCEKIGKIGYKDPGYMSMLVELYLKSGKTDEGLRLVKELLEIVETKNKRDYEPELLRLKGELLLLKFKSHSSRKSKSRKSIKEIENCFRSALSMARDQGAKSFELRAATSLARFRKDLDRPEESKKILLEIYEWFDEGFDTRDLKEAKMVLDRLS